LIYGWNGSGKTTLSRIFWFFEKKEVTIPEYDLLECNIQTDVGIIKSQDIKTNDLKIRVFNEEFVRENLKFNDSKPKSIVILGKENIGLKAEIEGLEEKRKAEKAEHDRLQDELPRRPKHDAILTEAAGEVPRQFGNTPLANDTYYGRSYRKPRVDALLTEGTIKEENLDSLIISDPNKISGLLQIIKEDKEKISLSFAELDNLKPLFESANNALKLSVSVEDIETLSKDKELRDWTETGFHLHKNRKAEECLFCHKQLPKGLIESFNKYFSDELNKARGIIDDNLSKLAELEKGKIILDLDSGRLFPESSKEFLKLKEQLAERSKPVYDAINELIIRMNNKRGMLHDAKAEFESVIYPKDQIDSLNETIRSLNKIFEEHNDRTEHLIEERNKAAETIELHTLASILKSKEYFLNKRESDKKAEQVRIHKEKLDDLIGQIASKRSALRNTALAIERINALAKDYFGEGQIYLEAASSAGTDGYVLKRRNKITKYLSGSHTDIEM
jgi:wobble nucleotide-excising tRNase